MTYEELVEKVNKAYDNADATGINEHVAVQFNVYGEGEGAFYVEVFEGKVAVAPFEYYDHDAVVIAPANAVVDMVEGKVSVADTYALEQVQVVGNYGKAALLGEIKKAEVKKAVAKTTAKKEEPAKATTTKKAATPKKAATTKKATTKKAAAPKKAAAKKEEPAKATETKTASKKEESSQLKLNL